MKKTLISLAILASISGSTLAAGNPNNNGDKDAIKLELQVSCSAVASALGLEGETDGIYLVLKTALDAAQGHEDGNGGFGLHMWGTIVSRDGAVCAVAMTGAHRGDQWPGSRAISAQKANTANAFSLPGLSLSTANLFTAVQPGGSLFGLQHSNPVNAEETYEGLPSNYGTANDPMVGHRIGGVNVFGGGLGLYVQTTFDNVDTEDEDESAFEIVGAIGVSGDSSCADHNIAWRTRASLGLDSIPGGVGPNGTDGIEFNQDSGWAHALCGENVAAVATTIGSGDISELDD